ncbi:acyltransferase family protein [Silvibacterium dinghuense]|uniref:Acyltransferase n=1 Tax=Silvibacterium dinghuense TaxID=1560006 RepID=A0A4Q1SCJ0_9BACT|nr:acyltransferase [Silvibacterium dinghuense]RXS94949.1 acyltransferase [Silvibacterium dinghuense]GGH09302.1 hypothetical protein GCM10011586_27220 [Silvibacterium dinghuense]
MSARSNRIAWIDIARGIGIILVVYGHVLRGLVGAHLLTTANPVWASDYTIYTFHMPLFFLLAGLQVDRSLSKGPQAFLRSKIITIAYPYLLWSLFQGGLQLLMPGLLNTPRSPWTLVTILWHPIAQFWFLYVLFLCHVIGFLTQARRTLLIPLLLISMGCALLAMHGVPGLFVLPATLAHCFVFYAAGILLSHALLNWRPSVGMAMFASALSEFGLGLFSHLGRGWSHSLSDIPPSWPSAIAGIALLICLSHLLDLLTRSLGSWFETLGRASLTIYIFHILAAAGIRVALKKAHLTAWPLQLAVGTIMGVGLPLLLHLWLERANLLAPLGLGVKRRSAPQSIPVI